MKHRYENHCKGITSVLLHWNRVWNCRVAMSVTVVAKNTCLTTGEGPYWEETTNSLVYVDITQGDVHRWSSVTNEDTSLHLGLTCFIIVTVSRVLVSSIANIISMIQYEPTTMHCEPQKCATRYSFITLRNVD